jgi:hypothetical protein
MSFQNAAPFIFFDHMGPAEFPLPAQRSTFLNLSVKRSVLPVTVRRPTS